VKGGLRAWQPLVGRLKWTLARLNRSEAAHNLITIEPHHITPLHTTNNRTRGSARAAAAPRARPAAPAPASSPAASAWALAALVGAQPPQHQVVVVVVAAAAAASQGLAAVMAA